MSKKKSTTQKKAGLTLERFCLIRRLEMKGFSFGHISRILDMPLQKLTDGYDRFRNTLPETPDGRDCPEVQIEIERQQTDPEEMDFIMELPVTDRFGNVIEPTKQKFINIVELERMFDKGMNMLEVAEELNIDVEDLRLFNWKNREYCQVLLSERK